MGAFRSDKQGKLIHAEELERRRTARSSDDPRKSTVQLAIPSVQELRDRYIVLLATREVEPERLTPSGYAAFEAHQQVAREFMSDDEDIYAESVAGHLMRQRLREIAPSWFEV